MRLTLVMRVFLRVTAVALVLAASARLPSRAKGADPASLRPNILLIVVDTLRFDAVSLSGRPDSATPEMARLARNGLSFKNAYSSADETLGSHFSLFTGFRHGRRTELNHPTWSIARQLGRVGYHTFGVAANLNLSQRSFPVVRPFGDYVCLGDVWRKMAPREQHRLAVDLDARIAMYGGRPARFNRLVMFASGQRVVDTFDRQLRLAHAPFLAFVNVMEPHDPYFPDPARYDVAGDARLVSRAAGFDGDMRERKLPREVLSPETIAHPARRAEVRETLRRVGPRAWQTTFDLDEQKLAIYRRRYEARVREGDAVVGRLMERVREQGLLESTIVVITSDHGESFGEKRLLTHSFGEQGDYEATHRVPMLWIFPPRYGIRAQERGERITTADVAPTLYDFVGLDWKALAARAPGNYGRSLAPALNVVVRTTSAADVEAQELTDEEKAAIQEQAEERLRALGYVP